MKSKKKKRISAAGIVRFVQSEMRCGATMMNAWDDIKEKRQASPRVWNNASDMIAADQKFWADIREHPPMPRKKIAPVAPRTGVERIADILKKHESESGSNIRELYSLAGKIAEPQEALDVLKEVDRFLDGWCPTAQCCAHEGKEIHERARAVLKKHGMLKD